LKGLFVPGLPKGILCYVISLIGTTVVPYNLFLHASLVKEKWKSLNDLKAVRWDMGISLLLGGLISMAIVISASPMAGARVTSALDLAQSLEPLLGSLARVAISIGLVAAGFSSAMTAPLAAAYVAQGCFGWESGTRTPEFRVIWISVLILGVLALSFSFRPIEIIQVAQFANGLLLPLIAIVLLVAMNQRAILKNQVNTRIQNALGVLIVLVTLMLGLRSIMGVLGIWS
jgi:Mn2+/Fe2+ NRAMP family transporter